MNVNANRVVAKGIAGERLLSDTYGVRQELTDPGVVITLPVTDEDSRKPYLFKAVLYPTVSE